MRGVAAGKYTVLPKHETVVRINACRAMQMPDANKQWSAFNRLASGGLHVRMRKSLVGSVVGFSNDTLVLCWMGCIALYRSRYKGCQVGRKLSESVPGSTAGYIRPRSSTELALHTAIA